jgi:hypothetical protein
MKTQTFEERINDQTKTPLSDKFVSDIFSVAKANNLTPTETWLKWREHCRINEGMDQSPTFSEFLSWNKLKGGNYEN